MTGARPTLVVVSGPPGSGKTTLAHGIAAAIGCPAVCRDEIKEGMVHAYAGEHRAEPGEELTVRTFEVFFAALRLLVESGVTVVAEAAFQDPAWRRGLEPIIGSADVRIVHCAVDPRTARNRVEARPARPAHADAEYLARPDDPFATFVPISIDAPSIVVETTDGYSPGLDDVVAFVRAR